MCIQDITQLICINKIDGIYLMTHPHHNRQKVINTADKFICYFTKGKNEHDGIEITHR